MKRCTKCHNKMSATATRCGMCGRHSLAIVNYRWPLLFGLMCAAGLAAFAASSPL